MEVSGALPIFACAAFGGGLIELLKWYQLRESPSFPAYVRSPVYWGLTIAMICAGGGLALLYGTEAKNAILVLNIGLSAPLMVKLLAESQVKTVSHDGPGVPGFWMRRGRGRILTFLSWR
jgi:hypothetical protein